MVSTRVSKRKANERPKRQRRASTKFGEESVDDEKPPPPTTKKNKKENAKKKTKHQVIGGGTSQAAATTTPKNTSEETKQQQPKKKTMKRKEQHPSSQAVVTKKVASVAAKKSNKGGKVKNTTAKTKKISEQTIITEPTTTKEEIDNDDDESIMTSSAAVEEEEEEEKTEVRVRVRLDEKLNKGYRFARLNTTKVSSTSKKQVSDKQNKAQTKPSVAKKRGASKVKQTVVTTGSDDDGIARDNTIRVKVRVEMNVNVRVRMDNKLMKDGRPALVNDSVMTSNGEEEDESSPPQELVVTTAATAAAVTSQKKKSPKITIRLSKKKKEEEVISVGANNTENGNVGTTSTSQNTNGKRRKQDNNDDATNKEEGTTDTTEQQQQQQQMTPPKKKVKITTQFGNDIDPKRLCIIDGCDKYKKARCGGHCLHHYEGLSDEAKAEIAKENELKKLKMAPEKKRCRVEGCGKYFKARHDGFCLTCYREHYPDGKKGFSDNDDGNEQESMPDLVQGGDDEMKKASIALSGTAAIAAAETNTTLKSAKHCNFEGCMKYKQKGCIGYCLTHKEYADPEQRRIQNEIAAAESAVKKTANKSSLCKIVGCDKYKQANCGGYCLQHVKAKQAYDDDDLEDVTKVRVRCDNRLQNGFCVAILSDENRDKLGLERPPAMSDEDEDGVSHDNEDDIDDDDVEMEQDRDAVASQPDFEISTAIRRKENGAVLCKAVGCPKIAQTKDDGFCRTHCNRYKISTGQIESWSCKCGERIAVTSLRCGKCHRWRNGHHPAYASSPQKSPGVASTQYAKSKQPKTCIPADAGVEISEVLLKNEKGRLLCKVIGCGKAEQSNNDGFCRTHFNQFAILTEDAEEDSSEKWICECGEEWSGRQKRCGNTSCQKVSSLSRDHLQL